MIVVMGVAGVGKTTVGRRLADVLGWPFQDGDALHSADSVELMRAGVPLTDARRAPWLAALAALVAHHVREDTPLVLACSALKRSHRTALFAGVTDPRRVALVYLAADPAILSERIARRRAHFFGVDLLQDQLAALEPPGTGEPVPVLRLDATLPPDALVRAIRSELGV